MNVDQRIECRPDRRRSLAALLLSAIVAGGLATAPAKADVLTFGVNTIPQLFGAVLAPVDLSSNAGLQQLVGFNLAANDRVAITFSAECSVTGSLLQWGTIQIEIDPAGPINFISLLPTVGADDAFCSGNGVATNLDGLVTASRTVITDAPAGFNTVRVQASAANGAAQLRLDDVQITIIN